MRNYNQNANDIAVALGIIFLLICAICFGVILGVGFFGN